MGERRSRLAVLVCLALGLSVLLGDPAARAMSGPPVDLVCPLCQMHFREALGSPSTLCEEQLDQLPLKNPLPWPMAHCPKCRLVLYKERLTASEIAQLRPFISASGYRLVAWRSSYYRLARIRERLGAGDLELAQLLLRAACAKGNHTAEWKDSMDESLYRLDKYLRTAAPRGEQWATAALLRGEILRQLARFAEAEAHFRSLLARSAFLRTRYADYLDLELQLIAAQDSKPHNRDEPTPQRLRELARELIAHAPGAAAFLSEFRTEGERVSRSDPYSPPRQLDVDRIVPRNAPFDLTASLSLSAWEDDPIKLDWKAFLDVYRPLRAAAARHRWLAEWLRAGPQRQAVVMLSDRDDRDTWGRSLNWEALWPELRRTPNVPPFAEKKELRYEVELRCGERVAARLLLATGDRPVLVSEISGCEKSAHFLDSQPPLGTGEVGTNKRYLPEEYLVIENDGRFVRKSRRSVTVSE